MKSIRKVIDAEAEAGEYDADDVDEMEGTCLAKIFFGIFGLLPLVWSWSEQRTLESIFLSVGYVVLLVDYCVCAVIIFSSYI